LIGGLRREQLLGRHVLGVPITTPARVRPLVNSLDARSLAMPKSISLSSGPARRRHEHVVRLQIAVDDAHGVSRLETCQDLQRKIDGLFGVQLAW